MTFRILTESEIAEFKKWARDNYVIGLPIKYNMHHPACTRECEVMNREHFHTTTVNTIIDAISQMDAIAAKQLLLGVLSERLPLRELVKLANDMEVTLEPQPVDKDGNSIV